MYSKILFPTDFGEYARQALQCVLEFRHAGLKEIIFLHVIDVNELGWYASANYLTLREEQQREIARIELAELEELVRGCGIHTSSQITTGIPSIEIIHTAKEQHVSIIIGGSHRKRKEQEEALDTTTARVVRHSSIPVFIGRYHSAWEDPERCKTFCEQQFSKILLPLDWSDCAMGAVEYVEHLKNQQAQEIIIAHVMDEHTLQYSDAGTIEEFRKKDLERLEHTKTRLLLAGFHARTHLHFGTPHNEIVRISKEENVSLIVMGHHGKGWLKNLLVGSTTERVLRHSTVPVLVVNDIKAI